MDFAVTLKAKRHNISRTKLNIACGVEVLRYDCKVELVALVMP